MSAVTTYDLVERLVAGLNDLAYADADDLPGDAAELSDLLTDADVLPFSDVGLLTSNDGLVLRLHDGSTFQITVVQSS